ncbi:lipoyltransferase and lipoate-protein ligase [Hoylesella oralis ATCC 33269]|uniref:lipoate--protein ligase n=1 Tax=Hoylesella oralis ATCC 33269 TaxID=873533 RepID=E7RSS2_9BACT|nr:lipoate--protein ligase [Hoylesella oralis]EFZ36273.1 lipoyltransferase and lipoate-protein ligase [Hoylesella oralis ATCC 33269]EPH19947.1 lipoyltransferase and lipoate-protein ligase [Hoylesella oralis HGA0225]SHF59231.1 lipoate-protein ligase A [Hoylesella oralis]
MVYISIPEKDRRLSFYLAMEEHIARHLDEDDCFFMWQVRPSVIFGRNQLIDNEVNTAYCRSNNISMYRRKSGGGCVYADMNNVMFSYITKDENVSFTFNKYIQLVVEVLQKMGVDAVASGRNDIMIDGKKVSGNAFYHIPGRSIVHGTMLYDTDMQNMVASITPSDSKLVSKGVKSVRQHIALLKDYTQLTLSEFKDFVRRNLCKRELKLTAEDIKNIEEIEKEYLADEFIYGNNPRYTMIKKQRINDVGELEIRMELKNNIIKNINIMGDYFLTGDIDNRILQPLQNTPYNKEAISKALPDRIDDIILHLRKQDFVDLL